MFELASALWERRTARSIVVATIARINGSGPRAAGSAMAVVDDEVIGSISGGCVEGAVYEACVDAAMSGPRVQTFGYSDEDAFAVGLTCGGELQIVVTPLDRDEGLWSALAEVAGARAASLAIVLSGPALGTILSAASDSADYARAGLQGADARRLAERLRAAALSGGTTTAILDCEDGPVEVLILGAAKPPRMVLFGAVDYSRALAAAAIPLGYRVSVCDPRPVFADPRRFPHGTEVVARWPTDYLADQELDERSVVCLLGHDDRYDTELLQAALERDLAYVGAMGSRVTHHARMTRLRAAGLEDRTLSRLHSPLGLDLGASTPEETAVSILAEIIACHHEATAAPLRDTRGSIHRPGVVLSAVDEAPHPVA